MTPRILSEREAMIAEVARLRADLERVARERDALRSRTHEIQEAADKRYSELYKQLASWRYWSDLIGRAEELLKCPEIALHSAYERAIVAKLLNQRDEAIRERDRLRTAAQEYLSEVEASLPPVAIRSAGREGLRKALAAMNDPDPGSAAGEVKG